MNTLSLMSSSAANRLFGDEASFSIDDDYENFSIDGDGNLLLPPDMTPSISHPLRLIPFDSQGLDPASLIGNRIQCLEFGGGSGFVLHTDQGVVTVTFSEDISFSRHADIAVDAALLEGLKPIEQVTETLYIGEEGITRAELQYSTRCRILCPIVQADIKALENYSIPEFGLGVILCLEPDHSRGAA